MDVFIYRQCRIENEDDAVILSYGAVRKIFFDIFKDKAKTVNVIKFIAIFVSFN